MASSSNEQTIWRCLHSFRNGIGVNELAKKTEISKPTIIKILNKLKKVGEIKYPPQKRGKKTIVILTKFTLQDNFRTLKKQRSIIEEKFDEPVIIVTKKGKIYGGNIDDYEPGIICIYDCQKLQSDKWVQVQNHFCYILLEEIDRIYEPNFESLNLESISLNDVLTLWLDHSHSIIRGIFCGWPDDEIHTKECNMLLHESLVNLCTIACTNVVEKDKEKLNKSMESLILHLLKNGEKIPHGNY